jgi:8-oxo-dGTP pyrophosphatase MutT (NUDIX family)
MFVEKVYAYITYKDKLLVFKHTQYPEAGIQVPGGTVEGTECFEDAVLREAGEETGLDKLEVISYLGMQPFNLSKIGKKGIQHRHFFHLRYAGPIKDVWRHYERMPSDGHPQPIEFEFYWVTILQGIPELAGEQGVMLHKMKT